MIWLACLAMSVAATAGESTTYSRRIAAGPQDRVQVSNVAGSVTVTAWDKHEVDVQAKLGSGVKRIDVTQRQGVVEINVVLSSPGRNAEALLDVHVPAAAGVEVSTVSASLKVEGGRGRMRLKSVSCSIRANAQSDYLEAGSVSGSIELRGGGANARVRATSVSGSVKLVNVGKDLEVRSTSGSLNVEADAAWTAQLHSVSGSIRFRGRLLREADLQAESVSGSVAITATADGGYRYEVSTFSGSINNCFGAEALRNSGGAPGRRLEGVRGDASASIRVKSLSGGVDLCDR
jgi:DUF4097 and DUF4098 domain-containing protein YvlB